MTTSNSDLDKRITSLVKYILDIKPYHTKLLGFMSEISFNDSLSLTLTDSQPTHIIRHQNVWGAVDIPTLAIVSDGTAESRTFVIPPTIMPRFSITDSLNYGQSPLGDDQPPADYIDSNNDGIPDGSYPWTKQASASHQLGSNFIPVRIPLTGLTFNVTEATSVTYTAAITGSVYTGYAELAGIPLTSLQLKLVNGITATVDASTGEFTTYVSGTYNSSFMAAEPSLHTPSNTELATAWLYKNGIELWALSDTGRYAVPFHNGARVRVNNVLQVFGTSDDWVTNTSRSFIQFMAGKHPAANDQIAINLMNADKLFISQCLPFSYASAQDSFTLTATPSAPGRSVITFTNQQPGTSKAIIEGGIAYPSQAAGATWTFTAVGLFALAVQQQTPLVGPIEYAYINEPFNNGKISFTLRAPWVEYYLTFNVNSYIAYDMLPFDEDQYEGPYDQADFWPAVDARTMYGQAIDLLPPKHPVVRFAGLGELKQRSIGGKPQYIFELFSTPPQGTFIELRVEQAKQLNPRLQLTMHERLSIVQLVDDGSQTTVVDTEVYTLHEVQAN